MMLREPDITPADLARITIGSGLESLDETAFAGCKNLKEVYSDEDVQDYMKDEMIRYVMEYCKFSFCLTK